MNTLRVLSITTIVSLACIQLASCGSDDAPAGPGLILFSSDRDASDADVFSMNADGTDQVNLTNNPGTGLTGVDFDAAWSPNRSKVLFRSLRDGNSEVYVMDADGSNQTNLTNHPASDGRGEFSPNGSKILFETDRDGDTELYVMNADGTGQTNLSQDAGLDIEGDWSANGSLIFFSTTRDGNGEIYSMKADGSDKKNLSNDTSDDFGSNPSPDGSKVLFQSGRDGNSELYVVNADGSGLTNLTNSPGNDYMFIGNLGQRSWSPDGSKIIFESNRDSVVTETWIMDADGTDPVKLPDATNADRMTFLPDSSLVFFDTRDGDEEIYRINMDGSDLRQLTDNSDLDRLGSGR